MPKANPVELTVEQFVAAEMEDLKRFQEDWKKMEVEKSEQYPERLAYGEWFEQYTAFCSSGR
jgi:hypothetical protein